MTHNQTAFLVGLFIFSSGLAEAQGNHTGGGRALVCRNDQHQITSARLLDLVEGKDDRIGLGLKIGEANDFSLDQISKDAKAEQQIIESFVSMRQSYEDNCHSIRNPHEIQGHLGQLFDRALKLQKSKVLLPKDQRLQAPDDLGEVRMISKARNCDLEAVGVYGNNGVLYVDSELFSAMDSTNQAAFFLHESVFTYDRDYYHDRLGEAPDHRVSRIRTSEKSRKIVAYLMTLDKDLLKFMHSSDLEFAAFFEDVFNYGYPPFKSDSLFSKIPDEVLQNVPSNLQDCPLR